jgi:hypothetical protein
MPPPGMHTAAVGYGFAYGDPSPGWRGLGGGGLSVVDSQRDALVGLRPTSASHGCRRVFFAWLGTPKVGGFVRGACSRRRGYDRSSRPSGARLALCSYMPAVPPCGMGGGSHFACSHSGVLPSARLLDYTLAIANWFHFLVAPMTLLS